MTIPVAGRHEGSTTFRWLAELYRSRKSAASTVMLAMACVAVMTHLGLEWHRRVFPPQRAAAGTRYAAGSYIEDTPDLGLKMARQTLVIVTSSTCHFCSSSMPFYRRLSRAAQGAGTRVVAVTVEDPTINRAYLLSNNVRFDNVVSSASPMRQ
jgi:hypothetical protein